MPPETRSLFGAITAGAAIQNIYLYCAAHNLNVGVRADIYRESNGPLLPSSDQPLHIALGLKPEETIQWLIQGCQGWLKEKS